MTESPLIWFAGAAVLVGFGLVLLSLSMSMAKRQGDGDAEGLSPGAAALFIDEPLSTDLAAALAGKTAPLQENQLDLKRSSPHAGEAPVADIPLPDGEVVLPGEAEDDTLEVEAPAIELDGVAPRTAPRRRVAVHPSKKAAAKPERTRKSRPKPGLFPRNR